MKPASNQQVFAWDVPDTQRPGLKTWPPGVRDWDSSWAPLVQRFSESPTGQSLSARLTAALSDGKIIYPPAPFTALKLTPLDHTRLVILGQDPYHGPGQAEGLAFSVPRGVGLPPSLRNIYKELQQSQGVAPPMDGGLSHWAEQGVLLLNTCLTVENGMAGSHARWGWAELTDALVSAVAQRTSPVVFMLWGAHAQTKKHLIDAAQGNTPHLVLEANHPSPLSAMRPPVPFLGCGHFARAAEFWRKLGEKPIRW
jgi:uracil-DNA glycosylase